MAKKQDVARLNAEHPDWTARQIAEALGCTPHYVRATASRGRFRLGRYFSPREIALRDAVNDFVNGLPHYFLDGEKYDALVLALQPFEVTKR